MERRTFLQQGALGATALGTPAAWAGPPPDVLWQVSRTRFRTREWLDGLFGDARQHARAATLLDHVTDALDGLVAYAHVGALAPEDQAHPQVQALLTDAIGTLGGACDGLATVFRGLSAEGCQAAEPGLRRNWDATDRPRALLARALADVEAPGPDGRRLLRRAERVSWQLRHRPLEGVLKGTVAQWDRLVARSERIDGEPRSPGASASGPGSAEARPWMLQLGGLALGIGVVRGGVFIIMGLGELSSCLCVAVALIVIGLALLFQGIAGAWLLFKYA